MDVVYWFLAIVGPLSLLGVLVAADNFRDVDSLDGWIRPLGRIYYATPWWLLPLAYPVLPLAACVYFLCRMATRRPQWAVRHEERRGQFRAVRSAEIEAQRAQGGALSHAEARGGELSQVRTEVER